VFQLPFHNLSKHRTAKQRKLTVFGQLADGAFSEKCVRNAAWRALRQVLPDMQLRRCVFHFRLNSGTKSKQFLNLYKLIRATHRSHLRHYASKIHLQWRGLTILSPKIQQITGNYY